jgi:hypothetical protein
MIITFPITATLDHESRGEFWKYCGQTFQMCINRGMPRDEARQFAIEFTNEKIKGFIEWEKKQ